MKVRFLARHRLLMMGAVLVVVAIVALAWIMGDTQPTRWIETPVALPSAPSSAPQAAQPQAAA